MSEAKYEVVVPRHLEEFIPGFLESRRAELAAVEAALGSGDLGELGKLALKMKGYGIGYGFEKITELGTELQAAVARADYEGIAAYLLLYREFLDEVRVTFA